MVVIQWKMWRLFKDTYHSRSNHVDLEFLYEQQVEYLHMVQLLPIAGGSIA